MRRARTDRWSFPFEREELPVVPRRRRGEFLYRSWRSCARGCTIPAILTPTASTRRPDPRRRSQVPRALPVHRRARASAERRQQLFAGMHLCCCSCFRASLSGR